MVYESLLLFGVAFFAGWLFFFVSGARDATHGWLRYALQALLREARPTPVPDEEGA